MISVCMATYNGEKYIKEQENEKQKSKFAPKIYLKDTKR